MSASSLSPATFATRHPPERLCSSLYVGETPALVTPPPPHLPLPAPPPRPRYLLGTTLLTLHPSNTDPRTSPFKTCQRLAGTEEALASKQSEAEEAQARIEVVRQELFDTTRTAEAAGQEAERQAEARAVLEASEAMSAVAVAAATATAEAATVRAELAERAAAAAFHESARSAAAAADATAAAATAIGDAKSAADAKAAADVKKAEVTRLQLVHLQENEVRVAQEARTEKERALGRLRHELEAEMKAGIQAAVKEAVEAEREKEKRRVARREREVKALRTRLAKVWF